MWWDLKDTVSHRAEVKGNDDLHDYEEEEYLCPCMGNITQFMEEEIVKEGVFPEEATKNISLTGLTIGDFVSDILKIYEERHRNLKSLKKEPRQKEIKF